MIKSQVETIMKDYEMKDIKYFMFAPGNRLYPDGYKECEVKLDNEVVTCIKTNGEKEFWAFDNLAGIVIKLPLNKREKLTKFDRYKKVLFTPVDKDIYTKKSYDEYQEVLKKNTIEFENATVEYLSSFSQTDVDVMAKELKMAQSKLVRKPSTAKYDVVRAKCIDEKNFMIAISAINMDKVLEENKLKEDDNQYKINMKTNALELQLRKSQYKSNITEYNAIIDIMEKRKDTYTEESWAKYQSIVDANKVSVEDSQKNIDTAKNKIMAARRFLVVKGSTPIKEIIDYTKLSAIKAKIAFEKVDMYTEESWNNILLALKLEETTQEMVDIKVEALIKAYKALELYDNTIEEPEGKTDEELTDEIRYKVKSIKENGKQKLATKEEVLEHFGENLTLDVTVKNGELDLGETKMTPELWNYIKSFKGSDKNITYRITVINGEEIKKIDFKANGEAILNDSNSLSMSSGYVEMDDKKEEPVEEKPIEEPIDEKENIIKDNEKEETPVIEDPVKEEPKEDPIEEEIKTEEKHEDEVIEDVEEDLTEDVETIIEEEISEEKHEVDETGLN